MSTAPSLYRRHRPRTFADVVGQEHVVRTLRNAVTQDKLHHAYLFVGSRGTGKTSMAKILASCLNCVNGPTVDPCGVCDSCISIQNAQSMDVIEMDAASNNSVDDIRELRDSVSFAPVSGKYKVYILDEAHMLTTAAWNAFLKTLEEPPPNTIFVLATTEANKVLPTVVDRCHRFDFQRPTVEQLASVLQRVAGREAIDIPPDAVALLARHATGSFRDALGTLEQLVTYASAGGDGDGTRIAVEDVLAVLGVADADLLFGALDAVAAHDARAALHAAAALAQTGRDVNQFVRDLEGHARELMLVQMLGSVPAEIAVTPDRDARLAEQAGRVAAADVVRFIDLLAAALRAMKDGADARTQMELALVKAATPEVDASAKALMVRLERLERALAAGGAPAPAAPPAVPVPAPAPAPERVSPPAPAPGLPPTPMAQAAPAPAPQATAPPATAPQAAAPPPPPPAAPAPQPPTATAPTATAAADVTLPDLLQVWPAVLDAVAPTNTQLAVGLRDARPIALVGREVTVAFDTSHQFQSKIADQAVNREVLGEAIRALTGLAARPTIEVHDLSELVVPGEAPAAPPPSPDDWVDRIKHEFDAEEIIPETDQP
ncbi:DNA polymerase III subunit gamma/tau [Paraconexibacter antarcticus]|uniref:DNA polymerase III subunit gamma/tau n=1 Tax=Paraconexibacter antarcticus TaxID=2949664 RepID=A0ABY5DS18_9ACTN|nr:DNA polymerase III subunit gamma/tau [Paraconexibacter antarcticus]UTI63495.1 DNA polymerase III subunit gamma/tau [Paraconexibacter antarcticus]